MKHHKFNWKLFLLGLCLSLCLAGCGDKNDQPVLPGDMDPYDIPDARTEQQAALDRENQAAQAEQEKQDELEFMENNTKPYAPGDNADNKTGTGMDGLEADPDKDPDDGGEPAADPDEQYAMDGNYIIPEGMPELTMEALGVPEWTGQPWAVLNANTPYFAMPEEKPALGETYSSLDDKRRPGSALICLREKSEESLPDYSFEIKAGSLSVPGWNEDAYPGVIKNIAPEKLSGGTPVDGKVFYMRRLIGDGLGSMALGRRNTMVCTEYMGEYGLQALEDSVLRYLERSRKRVIYRVTPVFEGSEKIARGAVVEAMSWGDSDSDIMNNKDLCFNLFVYNVQPGVTINYSTGATTFDDQADTNLSTAICDDFVLDTSRKEAHTPECERLVRDINPAVQSFYYGTTATLAAWSIDWNTCSCMEDMLLTQPEDPDETNAGPVPDEPNDNNRTGRDDLLAGDLTSQTIPDENTSGEKTDVPEGETKPEEQPAEDGHDEG